MPVYGAASYPCTVRAHRQNGRWVNVDMCKSPSQQASRDVMAFRHVWAALHPAVRSSGIEREVSRQSFILFYDEFREAMRASTKGFFSDYQMKCTLDVLCAMGVLTDPMLGRWPADCPAYTTGLRHFYPSLKRWNSELKYQCLMHFHAVYSKAVGAKHCNVPQSLAQICWAHRQELGHEL
eukprot:1271727-Karenia_brevis.AAC.2